MRKNPRLMLFFQQTNVFWLNGGDAPLNEILDFLERSNRFRLYPGRSVLIITEGWSSVLRIYINKHGRFKKNNFSAHVTSYWVYDLRR